MKKTNIFNRVLYRLISGVLAGICVAIGSTVFLSVENRIVGAAMFSIALLCILYQQYALFTGKVGYIVTDCAAKAFGNLGLWLLGNAIGAIGFGWLISIAKPSLMQAAVTLCEPKLSYNSTQLILLSVACGILMYLAVNIYSEHESVLGVLFCVPVFILCGFEHSIADMAYFTIARLWSLQSVCLLIIVILGNAIGACTIAGLTKVHRKDRL